MTKPTRKPTEPLRTRHVFLDTEVYRRAGFNISNTQFALLRGEIEAGRIVLHFTDITLSEIRRQLTEEILSKAADAKRLARDFNRISQIAGQANDAMKDIDGVALADSAWAGFVEKLIKRLRGHSVSALEIPARIVFERYFAGQAPFEQRGSKEFPDAFVIEGLARYCKNNDISMYVVSGDVALRQAAESHDTLLPLQALDEVLASATASSGTDVETIADEVLAAPGFDEQLVLAIESDLDFVDFTYFGSLTEGSVPSAALEEIISVDDYAVAAFDGNRIGLILQANAVLDAKVRYLDQEELRDKDDDIVPTELETTSRTHARLKIYVSIDLSSLCFSETELLTRDIIVE